VTSRLEALVERAELVTGLHPGSSLAVLALDKRWIRLRSGPRARNEYSMGTPWRVTGSLITGGAVRSYERVLA